MNQQMITENESLGKSCTLLQQDTSTKSEYDKAFQEKILKNLEHGSQFARKLGCSCAPKSKCTCAGDGYIDPFCSTHGMASIADEL